MVLFRYKATYGSEANSRTRTAHASAVGFKPRQRYSVQYHMSFGKWDILFRDMIITHTLSDHNHPVRPWQHSAKKASKLAVARQSPRSMLSIYNHANSGQLCGKDAVVMHYGIMSMDHVRPVSRQLPCKRPESPKRQSAWLSELTD